MNAIIIKCDYILELLEDIINQAPQVPTDLIICSSKEDFLGQVLVELGEYNLPQEPSATHPQGEADDEQDVLPSSTPNHILLSRALHILNASQYVNLIFCPTITVLRGYLSGYVPKSVHASQPFPSPFIILNMLAMHRGTSEFTLQGVSQTFAAAVSTAHRTDRALRLVECKDISDPSNPDRGPALWHAEVQLLSAAIKMGETGQNWGRRTISVMQIASRWMKVEVGNQDRKGDRDPADLARHMSEEEMLV